MPARHKPVNLTLEVHEKLMVIVERKRAEFQSDKVTPPMIVESLINRFGDQV